MYTNIRYYTVAVSNRYYSAGWVTNVITYYEMENDRKLKCMCSPNPPTHNYTQITCQYHSEGTETIQSCCTSPNSVQLTPYKPYTYI